MKVQVTNIDYDIDLPDSLEIDVPDEITDPSEQIAYISEEISNQTGFCHKGFNTNPEIVEE